MKARFSMDRLQTVARFTRPDPDHDFNDDPFSQSCIKIRELENKIAFIATNGAAGAVAIDPDSEIEDMPNEGFLFYPPVRIYKDETAYIDGDEIKLFRKQSERTLEAEKHIFHHTDSFPMVEKYINELILADYEQGISRLNKRLLQLFAPANGKYETGKEADPIYFWKHKTDPKATLVVTTSDPYWLGIVAPLATDELERQPNKVIRAIKHFRKESP